MQLVYANARRSITCTRAHVHRQSGVTDITARDLVLEINTHLLYNITEVQNLVATSALATLVHFAATRFLLFGNVHASFLFISTHAVPVQLFKVFYAGDSWANDSAFKPNDMNKDITYL